MVSKLDVANAAGLINDQREKKSLRLIEVSGSSLLCQQVRFLHYKDMQTVSRTLAEMYELAESVPMSAFPRELLNLLKKSVLFDGAILGRGNPGIHGRRRTKPQPAFARHDGRIIVDGANCIQVCRSLRRDSGEAQSLSVRSECCERCNAEQAQHSAIQAREVMMLATTHAEDGDWLVLCRGNDHAFNEEDTACLHEIWPHIVRSLALNRKHHLDERVREADGRVVAIVTPAGHIIIADSYFRELLSTEWPGFAGDKLPPSVLDAWRSLAPYRGHSVEIRFREQEGSLLCIARPHAALVGLTKTEGIVARHFASGLSHREVAQALGVSENTVRTHLKQAYSKLGVHDKAQLANRIRAPG